MEIKPISELSGLSEIPAGQGHLTHESPPQIALAQAKTNEAKTVEQLAEEGDPLAVNQVAQEDKELIPITSQHLLAPHLEHLPGAHEDGKGELIDIYD